MALTRSMLKDMQLQSDVIDRIIAAHAETVDALKQERDDARSAAQASDDLRRTRDEALDHLTAARQEYESLRQEFDLFRAQTDEDKHHASRQAALRNALLDAGANPQAAELLMLSLSPAPEDWDGDVLKDQAALVHPVKTRYAAFFSTPAPMPTFPVSPPLTAAPPLTKEDLRRMSVSDINQNWSSVCSVLSKGD